MRKAKQKNKDSILVATGCYAQIGKQKILEEIEEVDLVLGNNEKKEIIKYVEKFKNEKKQKITDLNQKIEYAEFGNTTYTEKTRAVVKIEDGCNNFCTYCIIPYARGRVRSRKIENVLKEIEQIAKNGIKEIVLTGIQIAEYGKDLEEKIELIDLLERINKIKGIERIRIRFIRAKTTYRRIHTKTKKTKQNMSAFSLITPKWMYQNLKKNE